MSEFEPSDPLAAIEKVNQLPEGTDVRVTEVRLKFGKPWYEVKTSAGAIGWINSTVLRNQQVERVE